MQKNDPIKPLLIQVMNAHKKSCKKNGLLRNVRSSIGRNEQLLTANRIFMKNELKRIRKQIKKLAILLVRTAGKFQKVTYKKSTLGHFLLSVSESLMDDMELMDFSIEHLDKNPLGILDGYGSTILLPRETATEELGFKKIQINSLYCRNSSHKFTDIYLHTLWQTAESLHQLAMDKKHRFKKISQSNSLKEAGRITGENIQLAKKILKKISPPEIPKIMDEKLKSQISLGAAGNLDLHHYKTRLQKL